MGEPTRRKGPEMRPPAPDKQPLRTNIYEFGRNLVSTLTPMFPYVDEGSIVPTCAFFYGGPEGDYGYFEHDNTVDEVAIIFGAGGTTGRGVGGLVRVSARSHGVGNLLTDPTSPESYSLVTVTQRQSTSGAQQESVAFTCAKCSNELFRLHYDATPPRRGRQREAMGAIGELGTIIGSAEAAERFNAEAANRSCAKCGHVNPPFPLHRWGWDRYAAQTRIAREASRNLESLAAVSGGA